MRRRRVVKWTIVVVVILVGILILSRHVPEREPYPTPEVAPRIGYLAPDFSLPTLSGQTVKLTQLRDKWVLITFWTTWCSACLYQEPHLQAAFVEKEGEIEFVGINIGEGERRVEEHITADITFTIALDTDQQIGRAYNVRYLPTTLLIDEEGIIRDIKVGPFGSKEKLIVWLDDLTSS
jgi:cytochrome c biogenesis protein CcmG, thiol:disulfide interchange protein DsbE